MQIKLKWKTISYISVYMCKNTTVLPIGFMSMINCLCIIFICFLPPLVSHTPSVVGAALFPHFDHAGKSLDTRLTGPQHGHLLVCTNIWPVHGKKKTWKKHKEKDGQTQIQTKNTSIE